MLLLFLAFFIYLCTSLAFFNSFFFSLFIYFHASYFFRSLFSPLSFAFHIYFCLHMFIFLVFVSLFISVSALSQITFLTHSDETRQPTRGDMRNFSVMTNYRQAHVFSWNDCT
jgi:hypothetical protein